MSKPTPIDFSAALDLMYMKRDLMVKELEMDMVNAAFKDVEPDDIETIQYIGFKNMTITILVKSLNGQVTANVAISQGEGIQDKLPSFNADGRVDFERSDYYGETLVNF